MAKPIEIPPELFNDLKNLASMSTCERSKCGAIIIDSIGREIGSGYNSKPCDIAGTCTKDTLPKNFKSDRTCCVHAEQRAIMNGLENPYYYLNGSTIWFLRLDENGNPSYAGAPYCTICSKMALDAGIKYFCLFYESGWTQYDTKEYNELSFKYENKPDEKN